jgi:hypothetical protein
LCGASSRWKRHFVGSGILCRLLSITFCEMGAVALVAYLIDKMPEQERAQANESGLWLNDVGGTPWRPLGDRRSSCVRTRPRRRSGVAVNDAEDAGAHVRFFHFRSKRPSPTEFSSMNSMPARCKAVWIAFTASSETNLRSFSKSTTVDRPNLAARASCDWVMPRRARAARHWAGVIGWINNFC